MAQLLFVDRFPLLPKAIEEQKHKIVFVQRNPKDVVVSYYPHTKSAVQYKGTFLQFVDMFMGKESKYNFEDYWHYAF